MSSVAVNDSRVSGAIKRPGGGRAIHLARIPGKFATEKLSGFSLPQLVRRGTPSSAPSEYDSPSCLVLYDNAGVYISLTTSLSPPFGETG